MLHRSFMRHGAGFPTGVSIVALICDDFMGNVTRGEGGNS